MQAHGRRGEVVEGWTPAKTPEIARMQGRWARLERLDPEAHARQLHEAFAGHDRLWDYLPYGPFSYVAYHRWAKEMAPKTDPLFWAIIDRETETASGVASWLRITPEHGVIEVGHICLSPALQRRRTATEAMFLMMDWAFASGYRRYEWKCDALNIPSRRAAQRLGFSHEGVFRQHMIVRGRNRDTAWFAITDKDWPALREAYATWLSPRNFDSNGVQKARLSDLTARARVSSDPAL